MPNFNYRHLSGVYRNGVGDRYSDYSRIDNMFIELSRDLPVIYNRLSDLEEIDISVLTSDNFTSNTIVGTIILEGSLPGSKITDGSITAAKLVLNSSNGIKNENIAANAAIDISKINLGTLSHTSLTNIGTLTHSQLESSLSTLGTLASGVYTRIGSAETNISTLQTQMGITPLNTDAQTVTAAINELQSEISGYVSPTISGGVLINGDQTQYHLLRATGVENVIEQSDILVAADSLLLPKISGVPTAAQMGHIGIASDVSGNLITVDESGAVTQVMNLWPTDRTSAVSAACSGNYWVEMSGNAVSVGAGIWELTGSIIFGCDSFSQNPFYARTGYKISQENGTNSGVTDPPDPSGLTLLHGEWHPGISVNESGPNVIEVYRPSSTSDSDYVHVVPLFPTIFTASEDTMVFVDPYIFSNAPNSARVKTYLYAKKIQ